MSEAVASGEATVEFAIMGEGSIVIFILLLIYVITGSIIEKKQIPFGHETGAVIIVGVLLSYLAFTNEQDKLISMMKFDGNLFFYLILPPIVFSAGYNMHRGKFFENFGGILFFGVLGTFVTYAAFSLLTYIAVSNITMFKYSGLTGETKEFTLSGKEILLMCSLLCSTDVIAAVSIVSFERQPKLYSLIFGEGIVNDAVCIILFNTVLSFSTSDQELDETTPFIIAGNFITLGFLSLSVGTIYALICARIFKSYRLLTNSPINESMLVFCFGYLAYTTAEMFHFSGIISLLTCAIVMAHYAWYNLSPQGKQVTSTAFQVIGYGCEAFCFSYLGLTFFSYSEFEWSLELFLSMLFIVIFGRFIGTVCFLQIIRLTGKAPDISFKEIIFMCFAGMIRGAIAFGLVLRLDDKLPNRGVIVTTSLSLVLVTTLFFGSSLGLVSRCLFGSPEKSRTS